MKLYIGVTDNDWYTFLAQKPREEVNFWSPGGGTFKVLKPNELFLFKLHAPLNYIVGGGFFVHNTTLPLSLAWEAFAESNGASSLAECVVRVRKYRKNNDPDPVIGCSILTEPFFFNRSDWIPSPPSFALNIVQGKGYDSNEGDGALLMQQVMARLLSRDIAISQPAAPKIISDVARYGNPYLTAPRLGQGGFRVLVTDAYSRRCALTGERTLPVLEAAHIQPFAQAGAHDVRNGLLMRSDIHKLFDRGYITVRPDLTIDVSPRIASEFSNGRIYYALQDKELAVVPVQASMKPDQNLLQWHNEQIFRR